MNFNANCNAITTCTQLPENALQALLSRFDMEVISVADGEPIPGSFFGEPEAGLIANQLYVWGNTPVHSALHEACHYICMDQSRRQQLDTDAGGHYDEENGVCFLQILLAEYLPEIDSDKMMRDMDQWGYTFRLGSARAWFEQDAEDAAAWLLHYGVIDQKRQPTWKLRI